MNAPARPSSLPAARTPLPQPLLIGLLLGIVTLCVYWPAIACDYVIIDDPGFVSQNPMVLRGLSWEGARWAFQFGHGDYWHPITWLSLMFDISVFGPGPGGLHFVNLLLHTANSLLLFALFRQWTGTLWRSALVAGLFALHPLHVESVAWITERKDVLSVLFFLLTLWAYGRYARKPEDGSQRPEFRPPSSDPRPLASTDYWLALIFFALGLMTKAMVVTTPFVLLLLDYWPWRRVSGSPSRFPVRLWLEKIPFFALGAISVWTTSQSQPGELPVFTLADLPAGVRIETAFVACAQYLQRLFWPAGLAVYYPHPWRWPAAEWIASILLVAGGCAAAIRQRHKTPWLAVGWFWFLGTLIPVLGLSRGWFQYFADRFSYLPLIGIFVVLAWGGAAIAGHLRRPALVAALIAGVALAACAVQTHRQVQYWRNSETLLQHTLDIGAKSDLAYEKLSEFLLSQGRIKEAIPVYRQALDLYTNTNWTINPFTARSGKSIAYLRASTLVNLGFLLRINRQWTEATARLEEALALNPSNMEAHRNLGLVFSQSGRAQEAIEQYRAAIQIAPLNAELQYYLGVALAAQGRFAEAILPLAEAVRLDPASASSHMELGNALFRLQRIDEALEHYRRVVQLKPADAEARSNFGITLALKDQTDDAIVQFTEALRLAPDSPDSHNNLGNGLEQKGQFEAAAAQYRDVTRLSPGNPAAHFNLGRVLAQLNQTNEAIAELSAALRLKTDYPEAMELMKQLHSEVAP